MCRICITLINSRTFLPLLARLSSIQTGVSVFRKADLQIDYRILLDHLPTAKVNSSVSVQLLGNVRWQGFRTTGPGGQGPSQASLQSTRWFWEGACSLSDILEQYFSFLHCPSPWDFSLIASSSWMSVPQTNCLYVMFSMFIPTSYTQRVRFLTLSQDLLWMKQASERFLRWAAVLELTLNLKALIIVPPTATSMMIPSRKIIWATAPTSHLDLASLFHSLFSL